MRRTSIVAYNYLVTSGALASRRRDVYKALYHHGSCTAAVLQKHLGKSYPSHVRARLTELRVMGLASELGEVICPITGHTVISWDVTDRVQPMEYIKPATVREKLAAYQALVKEVVTWMDGVGQHDAAVALQQSIVEINEL
jgi:hypothetical protein